MVESFLRHHFQRFEGLRSLDLLRSARRDRSGGCRGAEARPLPAGHDARARVLLGRARVRDRSSRIPRRSALALSTPRPSCARSAPSRGASPTSSRRDVRRTGATARIPTASSSSTSTRCCSSPRRPTSSSSTSIRCARSASIRASTTCVWSRTTGSRPRSAPRAWAGRCGWTAPRSRSSPTSSRCGGIEVAVVSAELTYGLDRIGMMLQGKDRVQDLEWGPGDDVGRPVAPERA